MFDDQSVPDDALRGEGVLLLAVEAAHVRVTDPGRRTGRTCPAYVTVFLHNRAVLRNAADGVRSPASAVIAVLLQEVVRVAVIRAGVRGESGLYDAGPFGGEYFPVSAESVFGTS
jgi:hypothetical protein